MTSRHANVVTHHENCNSFLGNLQVNKLTKPSFQETNLELKPYRTEPAVLVQNRTEFLKKTFPSPLVLVNGTDIVILVGKH